MKPTALACLMICPSLALAETVTIRSGEHETYSRLVLSIPEGADWEVIATETGYAANLGEPVDTIDASSVFERIPRQRIAGLVADGAALDLQVECTCHIDAFLYRPDMLVIDVIDGPAPADSPFELVAPTLRPPEDEVTTDGPEPTPIVQTRAQNSPNVATQTVEPFELELPLFLPTAPAQPMLIEPASSLNLATPRDPNLVEAERAILESFARAATQGIFDFPARPLPPPPDEGEEPALSRIAPMSDPMDGLPIPLTQADPEGPGFLLRTGLDRDALAGPDEEIIPAECPQDLDLDLGTWGEADGFGSLIPQLRLATVNEAGLLDEQAVLTLARAYIYYGFGLEARRTLETLEPGHAQIPLLKILAQLVDGDRVPVSDVLPYRSCGPLMETWIALAAGHINTTEQRVHSAILMGHRALPDSLRGHLGLRLAQVFAASGELFNAQEVLTASLRATTGNGPAAERVIANLAGQTDGIEAEVAHLDQFVATDPRATPDDMVRLLDLARENESDLDGDILEIAETMRFEADGTEPAAELIEAEVRLMLRRGQYMEALELLDGDTEPLSNAQRNSLRSDAMVALTEQAEDEAFLRFAFSDQTLGANHAAKNAMASRLLDLGFPEQGLILVRDPVTGNGRNDRLAIQAQIAQALDQLETEAAAVPNDDTPTAESPADLAEQIEPASLDDHDESSPLDGAWRAGAWETLEQSDDPLLSSASRALLSDLPPPGNETPLADRRALLEQARESRDLADGLLTRFSIDEDVPEDLN